MQLNLEALKDAPLGAVLYGWDPGIELSRRDEHFIRQGLRDYHVLVFRGQRQPTDLELVGFAKNFGDLVKGSEWFGDIDSIPEILRVNNLVDDQGVQEGTGASSALEWHADYSYVPTVGKESFLEAVEIPLRDPPQTCFCSQYAAFERLPGVLQDTLRSLRAHHSITSYTAGKRPGIAGSSAQGDAEFRDGFSAKKQRNKRLGVTRPAIPEAEHPVIVRHPESGREILYVSKGITRFIVGMPKDESDDLLKELALESTRPEYVYAHDWQPGDLVVFDSLGTLHRRDAWDPSQRRIMRQLSTGWSPRV